MDQNNEQQSNTSDVEEAAKNYSESLPLVFGFHLIANAFKAGKEWGDKNPEPVRVLSKEEIDAMVDKKYRHYSDSNLYIKKENYREGLIDMINHLNNQK